VLPPRLLNKKFEIIINNENALLNIIERNSINPNKIQGIIFCLNIKKNFSLLNFIQA